MTSPNNNKSSNIYKIYLYYALAYFYLWAPIWVIYLQERRGLGLATASLIDATFLFSLAVSEIPTGAVADVFGHKKSVILGLIMYALIMPIYGLTSTVLFFFIISIFRAIANSLISGAESAFLYEVLESTNNQSDYIKISGQVMTIKQISIAAAGIIGALLFSIDSTIPFFLSGVAGLLATLILSTVHLSNSKGEQTDNRKEKISLRETIIQGKQLLKEKPILVWTLAYAGIVYIPTHTFMVIFLQPHVIYIGISIAYIGFFALLLRLAKIVGFSWGYRFVEKTGEKNAFLILPILVISGLLGLAFVNTAIGIFLFTITAFAHSVAGILVQNLLQREVPNHVRATILSLESLVFRTTVSIASVSIGYISDLVNLSTAYTALIFTMIIAISILIFNMPKSYVFKN